MKKLILFSLFFVPMFSFAGNPILNCLVPSSSNASLTIELMTDPTMDFVQVTLKDQNQEFKSFSQFKKGEVNQNLQQGFFNAFLVTDQTQVDDGVYRNAGFLGLGVNSVGKFEGFMSAYGNVYPLSCTR